MVRGFVIRFSLSLQSGHQISDITLELGGWVAGVLCQGASTVLCQGASTVLYQGASTDPRFRCKVTLHFIINVFTRNSSSLQSLPLSAISIFSGASHLTPEHPVTQLYYQPHHHPVHRLPGLLQVRIRFSKTICCHLIVNGKTRLGRLRQPTIGDHSVFVPSVSCHYLNIVNTLKGN